MKFPKNEQELTLWLLEHQGYSGSLLEREYRRQSGEEDYNNANLANSFALRWIIQRELIKEIDQACKVWPGLPVQYRYDQHTTSNKTERIPRQILIAGVRIV
jgi:hypothetical protein